MIRTFRPWLVAFVAGILLAGIVAVALSILDDAPLLGAGNAKETGFVVGEDSVLAMRRYDVTGGTVFHFARTDDPAMSPMMDVMDPSLIHDRAWVRAGDDVAVDEVLTVRRYGLPFECIEIRDHDTRRSIGPRPGILPSALLLGVLPFACVERFRAVRRERRLARGACAACGYARKGLGAAARCPECGADGTG